MSVVQPPAPPLERRKHTSNRARLRSAIAFLTSIPLGTGALHRSGDASKSASHTGTHAQAEAGASSGEEDGLPSRAEPISPARPASELVSSTVAVASAPNGAPEVSIRLRGHNFRHISSRGQRESHLFRDAMIHADVISARIIFSRNKDYPSEVFSVIRYDAKVERAYLRERQAAATNLLLAGAVADESLPDWLKWKGRSYNGLLHAEFAPCSAERDAAPAGSGSAHPEPIEYHAHELDNPAIDLERQRIPYIGEGYVASILKFRNEKHEKDQLNEKFVREHPWLDFGDGQSLTLSKIRSLKKRALQMWWENNWEIGTIALAFVYFERLVFKRLVNKGNRKLAMATCLLLAYKMNEARETEDVTPSDVVSQLEETFQTQRKTLLKAEFPVFVHLGFALKLPSSFTLPHFERLLRAKGVSMNEYLGADLHQRFAKMHAHDDDDSRSDGDTRRGSDHHGSDGHSRSSRASSAHASL